MPHVPDALGVPNDNQPFASARPRRLRQTLRDPQRATSVEVAMSEKKRRETWPSMGYEQARRDQVAPRAREL
ncbi:MAG: hypothetical protein IT184_01870 [Acidobacteria bacterium]|nr:hypothetical protein [Acidobacteriota bacterium]